MALEMNNARGELAGAMAHLVKLHSIWAKPYFRSIF
jgi:hypothetical protein